MYARSVFRNTPALRRGRRGYIEGLRTERANPNRQVAFATSGQNVQEAIVSFGAKQAIPIGVVSEGSG